MKSFSFIFAGTSEFALSCLNLLLQSEFLSLKGIVTRPDTLKGRGLKKKSSHVKDFAQTHQFPVWSPHKADEISFLNDIRRQKCDFSFVCSYGRILPASYLQIFPKGSVNLHLSLLPKWRGAAPVQRALLAGDSRTGVCLQIMTEELDGGDIIGCRKFEIKENDNAQDVFDKSLMKTKSLLSEELIKYLNGALKGFPQDPKHKTYAHKIDKKEAKITWTNSSAKTHNKIRALFLGPQAFFNFRGKRIKIYQSKMIQEKFHGYSPGEVCSIGKDKLIVACRDGALSLLEVQREGKKRQKIEEFLKGSSIKLKDSFF